MKKKRSAAAIGRQNRQKGKQAEQAVVDLLKKAGYAEARRWPANMPAPVTGQKPPDLIVPELPWLAAEVKHAESMTPWKLLEQADTQGSPGQLAVGFMRKDSRAGPGQTSDRPMVVVMRPEAWLELVKLAEVGRSTQSWWTDEDIRLRGAEAAVPLEHHEPGSGLPGGVYDIFPDPAKAESALGGSAGTFKSAAPSAKGRSTTAYETQEAAQAWLRELRELAGPARDREAIREDLKMLSAMAGYQSSNKCEPELARLAEDLGVAPLYEEEG